MAEKTELQLLKERADKMGIKYNPNIGVDKLREKVNDALGDVPEPQELSAGQKKALARKEAGKLVRVKVTCLNPKRQHESGMFLKVGNTQIGVFTKYIEFGVPWHIPNILYNHLKEAQCQVPYKVKDKDFGEVTKYKWAQEYSVEKLKPLTKEELNNLAKEQAAREGL